MALLIYFRPKFRILAFSLGLLESRLRNPRITYSDQYLKIIVVTSGTAMTSPVDQKALG